MYSLTTTMHTYSPPGRTVCGTTGASHPSVGAGAGAPGIILGTPLGTAHGISDGVGVGIALGTPAGMAVGTAVGTAHIHGVCRPHVRGHVADVKVAGREDLGRLSAFVNRDAADAARSDDKNSCHVVNSFV